MRAYVQVSLADSNEQELYEKLKAMPEVENVHILFGDWDLIIKINVPDAELGNFVMEKIRSLPHVKLTSTMVIAK